MKTKTEMKILDTPNDEKEATSQDGERPEFLDGDMLITSEGLVFQVFGYQHPLGKAIAYLRYVPTNLQSMIPLEYESTTWNYQDVALARPRRMYSPVDLRIQLEAFSRHFPNYLLDDPYTGKTLIAVPRDMVKHAVQPQQALQSLLREKTLDPLEATAIRLVHALSKHSDVAVEHFGIHGSLSLRMHRDFSDIDLTVHGGNHYREVHNTIDTLAKQDALKILGSDKNDALRKNKGIFEDRRFVVNAIRSPEEVTVKYGQFRFRPLGHVSFTATVTNDEESHFKPAIYSVDDFKSSVELLPTQRPRFVVSMVSQHRGLVRQGNMMKGEGQLESAEEINRSESFTQVIIGTGDTQHREYLRPLDP